PPLSCTISFFSNSPAPAQFYTLSLHDALPIWRAGRAEAQGPGRRRDRARGGARGRGAARLRADSRHGPVLGRRAADRRQAGRARDRKSTRLNSSHVKISYAVFCLKKKKKTSEE